MRTVKAMESEKKPTNNETNNQEEVLKKKFGSGFEAQKPNYLKEVFKWFFVVIVAVVIALILRAHVFEWVIVQGHSMEKTLYDKQVLFINKLEYRYANPKKGDIIIIQIKEGNWSYLPVIKNISALTDILPPIDEVNYIKRVIGLPGDVIDIKDGYVYINGEKQDEEYAKGITEEHKGDFPRVVPANNVFVMGDNRQYSQDSRQIGFIPIEKIKGKASFRIKPLKEFGSIYD